MNIYQNISISVAERPLAHELYSPTSAVKGVSDNVVAFFFSVSKISNRNPLSHEDLMGTLCLFKPKYFTQNNP